MSDEKLWREEGPKALLEFLSSATGEDYDAAVYDTKFDFDSSNIDAVKYVASVAMTKASLGLESFETSMPTDGSLSPYESECENERICQNKTERIYRENHAVGPCIYVPDSSRYCQMIANAIRSRGIPYEEMTESERIEYIKHQQSKKREDWWFTFWHHYFPMIMAILFACIGFFGILIKLSS